MEPTIEAAPHTPVRLIEPILRGETNCRFLAALHDYNVSSVLNFGKV